MTQQYVNARSIVLQVREADGTTWTSISAIKGVKFSRAENEETADNTNYDSDGAWEGEIMQRGASMEIEGLEKRDDLTAAQDPGQARCEYLATQVAAASVGAVRFRHPAATTWEQWGALVSIPEGGGATNDKSAWKCKITRTGTSTFPAV